MNSEIKVIQFGEGNFLRGFVDWMIQKMNDQGIFNGQVALVQPLENGLIHLLEEQNYEYTHFLKGIKDGEAVKEHYVNKSIKMGVNPYTDFNDYLSLAHIESASIIVSNTTEAGITFDPNDKIEMDAKVTYPGKLTRLLLERYKKFNGAGDKGYILLPCELINVNGDKLKENVLKYIELWNLEDDFKKWVLESNEFCNTLVDRIVPGYPRDTIEEVWKELGYKDQLVVESEQFNLWVIQGGSNVQKAFPANEAGCNALFVQDVTPYKTRKVRILNGAHTTLVPVGYLYGLRTVGESTKDPKISKFLLETMFEEIVPTLTLPADELEKFSKEVLDRFRNPFIHHELMSISLNSMSKYKTRVLPSVIKYIELNSELPKRLVLALASYIVFYRGEYNNESIAVNDGPEILEMYNDLWSDFNGSEEEISHIVDTVLSKESLWEGNLALVPDLKDTIIKYVATILDEGIETIIDSISLT